MRLSLCCEQCDRESLNRDLAPSTLRPTLVPATTEEFCILPSTLATYLLHSTHYPLPLYREQPRTQMPNQEGLSEKDTDASAGGLWMNLVPCTLNSHTWNGCRRRCQGRRSLWRRTQMPKQEVFGRTWCPVPSLHPLSSTLYPPSSTSPPLHSRTWNGRRRRCQGRRSLRRKTQMPKQEVF